MLDFHLPQFISAMFTAETGFMVFFFVHYESIHRVGSPPTYRAQLRPWYSNLFEKGEMQVGDEEHFFWLNHSTATALLSSVLLEGDISMQASLMHVHRLAFIQFCHTCTHTETCSRV